MSKNIFFGCLLVGLCFPAAWADGDAVKQLLLAELIVGQEKPASPKPSGARSQREQAGAYARDSGSIPVVVEDDEPGFLSPRGGAPADERAYEGRSKARNYQQGGGNPPIVTSPADSVSATSDMRGRAKAYTGTGNVRDIDLSNVGRDGIPIVPCQEVDNVSGRIGDDSAAGAIVYLVRQGKQIKVRCK